ncbi:MAG: hypothetical protein WBZ42_11005, partial [Halobacteriota archaeon]
MQPKDAILKLIEITPLLDKVSFRDVLELTSPYKLQPIDPNQQDDKELIETITKSCRDFLALCNKIKRRFQGARINEVSKAIENELVEEIRKTGLSTKILSEQGYPDIELADKHNRVTYLEVKISSKKKKTGFRAFYYSTGKKITSDARHLLLGLLIAEESDKYWKIEGWTLTDLSKLDVHFKAEFNASNIDMYTKE